MPYKVTVCGAAGGIGQPLSLLLKLNTDITDLALYDIVNVPGVAADLSHINTPAKVTAFLPDNHGLKNALADAQLVIIPAGVPRKPGMTRDDLFKINAGIIRDLATAAATYCPNAFMLIISNPVNSTVPIVAEVFKSKGVYNPKRIFGVTTLDVVRSSRFVSDIKNWIDPVAVRIPIVGGHSGPTIVPLLSQIEPAQDFTREEAEALTKRIQYGGDEVVQAKNGAGSATLSMAHAGARFAQAVIAATLRGEKGVVEPTFVALEADSANAAALQASVDGLDHFALPVELGPHGVERIHPIGSINAFEKELLAIAIQDLKGNIQKGVDFVAASK
ncbi:malate DEHYDROGENASE, NAD-dependent [Dimargaris cristalligena]|uniref:Malate dehydrogenase n=1 Tax=Dimargaris cristalligena TaxID=215637 RepID=A0A4P9ZML1_9FUNG|nr:malate DEHYDROGENASE, NAD-dependent [Dimargaris cristalligena]RKP33762.1 NAD-malate dehydrogenase [Dimargaris cristalligena]|eukprot:RKP33762.1 NAD-malate dehydrogenase [Dimargaris cristalligena]